MSSCVYASIAIDKPTRSMTQEIWHENTSVSCINYHFVWCVRRRKKLLTGEIDKRLLELIPIAAKEIECEVIALESDKDHVHLFVQAKPKYAPYQIMHKIKQILIN